jgi:hypothetical protein
VRPHEKQKNNKGQGTQKQGLGEAEGGNTQTTRTSVVGHLRTHAVRNAALYTAHVHVAVVLGELRLARLPERCSSVTREAARASAVESQP